jgi:heme exporter protein B
VTAVGRGLPALGQIYLLAALCVLALTLAPLATAGALRVRMS